MSRRDDRAADRPRVLAVASGGGHWVQLMRLRSSWDGCDVAFVTVNDRVRGEVALHRFYTVNDATRWNKLGLIALAMRMARIVARERPDVVITTGAAPGLFAVIFGRLLGARTVWIDSIANVERLSLSGRLARPFASMRLTQWPHLARKTALEYAGAVL